MHRREFLRGAALLAGAAGTAALVGCTTPEQRGVYLGPSKRPPPEAPEEIGKFRAGKIETGVDVAIAREGGRSPAELVTAAVEAIGGMAAFVQAGDAVVIKPNLGFATPPVQGATTHPEVLSEVIRLVKAERPGEVIVCDRPIDGGDLFKVNGAEAVCQAEQVSLYAAVNENMFEDVLIGGEHVRRQPIIKDILECDVYIDLPVAKQHNATDVCLSMKNQLGSIWRPQDFHNWGLHECIAELAKALRPTLSIIDAVRVLLTEGPKGPGYVEPMNTVLAGVDMVSLDIEGAKVVGYGIEDINEGQNHLSYAATLEVGLSEGYRVQEA
ncbi:MAG: DUF362 domain-containing protein [Armatimonadota bacterium]